MRFNDVSILTEVAAPTPKEPNRPSEAARPVGVGGGSWGQGVRAQKGSRGFSPWSSVIFRSTLRQARTDRTQGRWSIDA